MNIPFTKLQSAGNDFVLIEEQAGIPPYPALSRLFCDRHFGIGADGLLVLTGKHSTDVGMKVFNQDGSEAEACGNGLRCLVKYVVDNKICTKDIVSINTMAGVRVARVLEQAGSGTKIETSMGRPLFTRAEIPVGDQVGEYTKLFDINILCFIPFSVGGYDLSLSMVSMGNPHAIHYTNQPVNSFPLSQLGPLVENSPIFPHKTNFEVARIINRQEIEARVWERGSGETLACGSGASAIAVVSQLLGLVDNPVMVTLPGGALEVRWERPGQIYLTGIACTVFCGHIPVNTDEFEVER